jgi:hypothetical protein
VGLDFAGPQLTGKHLSAKMDGSRRLENGYRCAKLRASANLIRVSCAGTSFHLETPPMTKIVTVQSQQRWDYYFETRRTEASLVVILNELGQQGWELVTAMPYKDVKGIMSWGAFLKRPSVAQTTAPNHTSAAATPSPAAGPAEEKPKPLQGFDLSGDEFQLKTE